MDLLCLLHLVAQYDAYLKENYGKPVDFPHIAYWARLKADILTLASESEGDEE